jgi:LuxR family transcriptional regulator, quorum-sensing system regulator BjaR1
MLSQLMERVDGLFSATTAEEASQRYFDAVRKEGATYIQTRAYSRPTDVLTSSTHFAAGGVVLRISPSDWPGSEAFNYICFDNNPLLDAIRQGRTRYRFTDFAPHRDRQYGPYWDALSEAGIGEALCATSYGAGGRIASLHLGFASADIAPDSASALQIAGLALTERLIDLMDAPASEPVRLTARERDSLTLVAEGKTDWEISVILGVSEPTARFHVDNARRKLGAVSRAQAVAKMLNQRLL